MMGDNLYSTSSDQGCKRDGILRDGRILRSARDRDSKIIFLRDGTGLRFSGQRDRQKTVSRNFFILLKIICDKGIIKQTDEIVGY